MLVFERTGRVVAYGTKGLQIRVEVEEMFQKSSLASLQIQWGEQSAAHETSSLLLTQLVMGLYTLQDLSIAGAIRHLSDAEAMVGEAIFPSKGRIFISGTRCFKDH